MIQKIHATQPSVDLVRPLQLPRYKMAVFPTAKEIIVFDIIVFQFGYHHIRKKLFPPLPFCIC